MDAREFQESLNDRDIYSLLEHLGGNPKETSRGMDSQSICHNHDGSGKHNLRYFSESHSFNCFSSCGHMSVYDLVSNVLELDFYESFKYVLAFFNQSIYDMSMKTVAYEDKVDIGFFDRNTAVQEAQTLTELNSRVLNVYYNYYYQGWIDEGISVRTMEKYKIKNSIVDQQIIIPHYDEHDRLVGVRCRNLNPDLVAEGKKYMPVFQGGDMLNHSTGSVLYGLNFNKENINRVQKVILFESEKSVMKLDSYMPDMSIGVCLSGSNLTNKQVDILTSLNVSEVIIALDKEYHNIGDQEEKYFAKKIEETFLKKLDIMFSVSVIWDTKGLLDYQDSPVDKGVEVFKELLNNRIILN